MYICTNVETIESSIRASRLLVDDDDANSEAAHIWVGLAFEIADRLCLVDCGPSSRYTHWHGGRHDQHHKRYGLVACREASHAGEQLGEQLDTLVQLLAHVCDEAHESGRRSGEALHRQGYDGAGGTSDCAWGTIIDVQELTTDCQKLWAHLHEEQRNALCDWARGLALSAEAEELADLREADDDL